MYAGVDSKASVTWFGICLVFVFQLLTFQHHLSLHLICIWNMISIWAILPKILYFAFLAFFFMLHVQKLDLSVETKWWKLAPTTEQMRIKL